MLFTVHEGLGNAATMFALLLAGWGTLRYIRGLGVDGSFLGAVVIIELLMVAQVAAGALLYLQGARPERASIHILYGITALISFPAMFAYTKGRDSRLEQLLWALLALFVWGLLLRAQQVSM